MRPRSRIQTTGPNNGHQLRDYSKSSNRSESPDLEMKELVTNCDRFESLKHSSSAPYAFTEQGISMLSAVVTSQKADQKFAHIK